MKTQKDEIFLEGLFTNDVKLVLLDLLIDKTANYKRMMLESKYKGLNCKILI